MIAYRAMLDVPRELVTMVAGLLRAERRARGTRKGTRLLSCLRSRPVFEDEEPARDVAALVVLLTGSLEATGDPWLPFRLLDPGGAPVEVVAAYLRAACRRTT